MSKSEAAKLYKAILKQSKNLSRLSKEDVKQCWRVINSLTKDYQPGYELCEKLDMKGQELRKYIMYIRREMVLFQNPTGAYFIVSTNKGYKLSNNPTELKAMGRKMVKRYENLEEQLRSLKLITLNANENN